MIEVPSPEPLNVLLVEDNPGDAALMTARLQLAGGLDQTLNLSPPVFIALSGFDWL